MRETIETKMWHSFGGVMDGLWVQVTMGPTSVDRREPIATELDGIPVTLRHLATFDHEPSEAEKDALCPPEYA